jgi:hypothetical protein
MLCSTLEYDGGGSCMMEFEHRRKEDGEIKERAVMVGLYITQ